MRRALALSAVFACILHTSFARADNIPPPPPSASTTPPAAPSAPPTAPSAPSAPPATPAAPSESDTKVNEEVRRHFKAGVALLQDQEGARVEEAYREFKAAYELGQSPKVLGNMGYCAMKLERDGEAIDAYSRYLREVPDIDAEERAQIMRDLQTLTVGVVQVAISTSEPTALVTDVRIPVRGDRITNVYQPQNGKITIGMRAGHHLVTVRAQGFADATWEFDAMAGARESHDFALQKAIEKPPPPPAQEQPPPASTGPGPWPLVLTGVGAAALITGSITGVVALNKTHDIEKACPANVCPRGFDLDGAKSSTTPFVVATDFLLIGGGVLLVGGGTWWLLTRPNDDEKSSPPPATVGGACTSHGCFGEATVRF
jgi:hypothetical protein